MKFSPFRSDQQQPGSGNVFGFNPTEAIDATVALLDRYVQALELQARSVESLAEHVRTIAERTPVPEPKRKRGRPPKTATKARPKTPLTDA